MGKAEVFKIPVLGAIFRALGGFPVARDGTDRKAVRDSMAMLQAGDVLAVFPEGTRQHGPKIQPLQPGAAYLALRADVPIVPIGIAGTEEIMRSRGRLLPRFGRVAIVVGEPLVPPPRTTSDRAARRGRRAHRASSPRRCSRRSTRRYELRDRVARGSGRRARRAPRTRRGCGRRRAGRRRRARCCGSPPSTNAATASSAGISSRSSRGGGKYSSSSVTRTASTPCDRRELRDHRFDEVLGCARAGGDADDARVAERVEVELVGAVDAQHDRAAGVDARPS